MENPIQVDDLGAPPVQKTYGNLQFWVEGLTSPGRFRIWDADQFCAGSAELLSACSKSWAKKATAQLPPHQFPVNAEIPIETLTMLEVNFHLVDRCW